MSAARMRTGLATALLAGLAGCGAPPAAAPSPRWQLLFFHPFRPGVLQQCEDAHLQPGYARDATPDPADPRKAWVVEGPLAVAWPGGQLLRAGLPAAPPARPATDVCFTLQVDGQALVSGAVVPEHSARLLRFPTLVLLRGGAASAVPQYRLQTRFPAETAEPAPPAWAVLGAL